MKNNLPLILLVLFISGCALLDPEYRRYETYYREPSRDAMEPEVEEAHPLDTFKEVQEPLGSPDEILSAMSRLVEKEESVLVYFDLEGVLEAGGNSQPIDMSRYESIFVDLTLGAWNGYAKRTLKESYADMVMMGKLIYVGSTLNNARSTVTFKITYTFLFRLVDPKTYSIIAENTYTVVQLEAPPGSSREGESKIITKQWE